MAARSFGHPPPCLPCLPPSPATPRSTPPPTRSPGAPSRRSPPAAATAATPSPHLPEPLARVLLSRLDARVDREVPAPASDWVDSRAGARRSRAWRDAAREAARVPAPAWAGFLGHACRLVVSHLVRPAETLAAVAFEDAATDEIPTAVALRRLQRVRAVPGTSPRSPSTTPSARASPASTGPASSACSAASTAAWSPASAADEWTTLLEPHDRPRRPALVRRVGPDAAPRGVLRGEGPRRRRPRAEAGPEGYTEAALRQRLAAVLPTVPPARPRSRPDSRGGVPTRQQGMPDTLTGLRPRAARGGRRRRRAAWLAEASEMPAEVESAPGERRARRGAPRPAPLRPRPDRPGDPAPRGRTADATFVDVRPTTSPAASADGVHGRDGARARTRRRRSGRR